MVGVPPTLKLTSYSFEEGSQQGSLLVPHGWWKDGQVTRAEHFYPKIFSGKVIKEFHDTCHLGQNNTYMLINKIFAGKKKSSFSVSA